MTETERGRGSDSRGSVWKGYALLSLSIALAGCGSSEAPPTPALTPVVEPTTPSAEPEIPSPELPPTAVALPEPTPSDEDLEDDRDLEPVAPLVVEAPVTLEGMAPGNVLALTQGGFEMLHSAMTMDVVAYAPNVQEAILRALRSKTRAALDETGFELASDDWRYPNTFSGACRVAIALPDLVSYYCQGYTSVGRGGGEDLGFATTWDVTSNGALREVETDDLLVAGTDYDGVAEPYEADPYGEIVITPVGLGFVGEQGVTAVPYAALGTLIRRDSVLARVPGALDHANEQTALAHACEPPDEIDVVAEARPFAAAVLLGARTTAGWMFASPAGGLVDPAGLATVSLSESAATRLGLTRTTIPWNRPARLGSATLRRATALRTGPHGRPAGAVLPAGTAVVSVIGEVAGGASRNGGGQWTLVVASESRAGWVPSGLLDDGSSLALPRIDWFLASLPEGERAAARATAMAIQRGLLVLVAAESPPGSTTIDDGLTTAASHTAAPSFRLTHEGTIADVRRTSPEAQRSATLLLVAWQLSSAPTTLQWEVYAEGSATAETPVARFTTPLPSVPARERVTVTTAITRHGTFYPVVVRGPGRAETLYTWDGSALVAPPAPATE